VPSPHGSADPPGPIAPGYATTRGPARRAACLVARSCALITTPAPGIVDRDLPVAVAGAPQHIRAAPFQVHRLAVAGRAIKRPAVRHQREVARAHHLLDVVAERRPQGRESFQRWPDRLVPADDRAGLDYSDLLGVTSSEAACIPPSAFRWRA